MLTLLLGTDWTRNRNEILQMLADDVASRKGNRILLVPELISHDMERRLCAAAGNTTSRYAEVTTFSRLTGRICEWNGSGIQDCLDNGGRLVAMAAATRQLHSKLKAYAAFETKPEFLSALIDAVDEFKRCCISSQDLASASKNTEGAFSQKLEELSLILDAYDGMCRSGKRDPRDLLTWGLEQLQESNFAENHVFYIDGFPDFTVQNFSVIEHLILHSGNVTISMNCDCPGSSALAFSKAGDTTQKLLRIADQNGIPVNIKEIGEKQDIFTPVRENLLQGKLQKIDACKPWLRTVQAESIYNECILSAEQILELVHGGARYRDIAVVCADLPTYRNALTMQFQQCMIPSYVAGTDDILDKSVIATVLTALEAALGGFDARDVMRYLKSPLSPLSLTDCDHLENYAIQWDISGKKWLRDWNMHPEGLQDIWTTENEAELYSLNYLRSLALEPLQRLEEAFTRSKTLSQQIHGLYQFLDDIQLQQRLSALGMELDGAGDNRSAQIMMQLWDILLSALEQMADVLGHTHWDNESFIRLFKLLLSHYDVGTIPPVLDSVMIGSISAMRCQEVKHLIVVGATEGCFPAYGASTGVLSDHERSTLRKIGVPLTGGAAEGLEIAFSEIYSIFCAASTTIYVSCPSGKSSFIFRRLSEMAGGDYCPQNVLGAAAVNPAEAASYLHRKKDKSVLQDIGLKEIYDSLQEHAQHELGSISVEGIQELYGSKLNLSASQIDKQADCRLAYFLKYGLRAKEQKTITVDPAEFGTYVHAVLEQTAREICRRGGFKTVTLSDTLDIASKYSDTYISEHFSQLDSQRIAYLFRRNNRELMMVVEELWNEFQESSFIPIDFEVAFGDNGKLPAIQIPGETMPAQLRGFVDRVDAWQEDGRNYFRVVDYKTGKKDFDYCDVFNGLGLQMLLYLFALEQEGASLLGHHPIPAGVQYFPARVPILTADSTMTDEEADLERRIHWRRSGLLLGDDDVLFAMENTDSPKRLCCRKKKDGSITGDVADRDQFKLLCRYVFRLLSNMVDEIASGNVKPNPYTRGSSHNACRFCPYGSVCHAATVEGRRNYKTMSSQRFWDEVVKEMKDNA